MKSSHSSNSLRLNGTGFILGIVQIIIFILVRIFSPSPYETLYRLDPTGIMPPVWLLSILSLVWYFITGYSAGSILDLVLCRKLPAREEISSYQGLIFYVISFFISHIWYTVFFGGEHLFAAILILLSGILSAAICSFCWSKSCLSSSLIMGSYGLWLFYLFILNLSILLHI